MRLLLKFAKEFETEDVEKDVDANETVENLAVLISLVIPEFNTYDLYYRGSRLDKPKVRLGEVIDSGEGPHEIRVVKKGSSVLLMDQARAFKNNITDNLQLEGAGKVGSKLIPIVIALVLMVIVFGLLG